MVDQAGELRVSVRTADANLSQNLRESLPELVEGLDHRGYNTEIWRPAAAGAASGPHRAELRTAEAETSGGQGFGPRDGSTGQGGRDAEPDRQPPSEEWENVWNTSGRQTNRRASQWQVP